MMLDAIEKRSRNYQEKPFMSILIPSWNNLPILKWCIDALRKNNQIQTQIIVFINEGKDGTIEWVKEQADLDYVISPSNMGICYALNSCRSIIKADYLLYLNDDMYVLPGWDVKLKERIEQLNTKMFMISATLIEPRDTGNVCVVVKDFGDDLDTFDEEGLLSSYQSLYKKDWVGSTWPPNIMHVELWDLVGGLSVEYSPGMYSDPDFSKKIYDAGVRILIGIGDSLVYHFGSKSTKKLKKNTGRIQFIMKWGMTAKSFTKEVLHLGAHTNEVKVEEVASLPSQKGFVNKLKRMYYSTK